MLLTISQPSKTEFGVRSTHEFSPRIPFYRSSVSTKPKVESPVSSLRASVSTDEKMSTPHRGLPPPSAMALPDPSRPPPSLGQPLGAMPNPPSQWQGQEESMRNWLVAKAEEDKRKQEEEKTRQESYRLEQRRIEQSMLRESLQAGVPPSMVPMIYAGIGGANLANVSLDWLQQYASQLQQAQQQIQQQQASPDLRRETRLIQAPATYPVAGQQHQVVPSQPTDQTTQPAPLQTTFSAYQPAQQQPPRAVPPTSAPRSAHPSQLPRLTTNEMFVHQPPPSGGPGSAHPLQQTQTISSQDAPSSSPSIYFHHWVPPNESSKSNQPQTPASKGGDPTSAHPGSSHLSSADDYKESPRKRKAQGGHHANPPPPHAAGSGSGSGGQGQYTSPSFSTASTASRKGTGGHVRSRSNASARESESRSESRPDSRREGDAPPRSTAAATSAGAATMQHQQHQHQHQHQHQEEGIGRRPSEETPRPFLLQPRHGSASEPPGELPPVVVASEQLPRPDSTRLEEGERRLRREEEGER